MCGESLISRFQAILSLLMKKGSFVLIKSVPGLETSISLFSSQEGVRQGKQRKEARLVLEHKRHHFLSSIYDVDWRTIIALHPSYIEDVAESIKKLRGNHITTILLLTLQLSHFIREEETVSLVVMQKEEEGERKG
nr:hypothetical protein [Gigaspora margarita]